MGVEWPRVAPWRCAMRSRYCSLNGQQCVSSGVETPTAYPLESRNTKHGSSLLDKLSLGGTEAAERGLSGGRLSNAPSTVARRDELSTSPSERGPQGAHPPTPRIPRLPHRSTTKTHPREPLQRPTLDRLETYPAVVAYTSRLHHAKTRIDAPPCCRRIVLDPLRLLSLVLDHGLTFLDTPNNTCCAHY